MNPADALTWIERPMLQDQQSAAGSNDLEAQTRRAMDGIKQTLEAAGASFKDVVHVFVLRARAAHGRHR
jgi:enamine deaminase RidA (YjgF/YER057c/UK114 family)